MKRRAFISMMMGAAGALVLPQWRKPHPIIILPPDFDPREIALSYKITRQKLADNLYLYSKNRIIIGTSDPATADGVSVWSYPHPGADLVMYHDGELRRSSLETIEVQLVKI